MQACGLRMRKASRRSSPASGTGRPSGATSGIAQPVFFAVCCSVVPPQYGSAELSQACGRSGESFPSPRPHCACAIVRGQAGGVPALLAHAQCAETLPPHAEVPGRAVSPRPPAAGRRSALRPATGSFLPSSQNVSSVVREVVVCRAAVCNPELPVP